MAYKSKYKGSQVDAILDSVANKQDKLTAGTGISIVGNTISATYSYKLFEVVSELPTQDIDNNKIYLVAATGTTGENNTFVEYVYVNNKWEKLGEFATSVSLDGYATEDYVDTAIDTFNTSTVTPLATRVTTLESQSSSTGESLEALTTRVTTAEGEIDTLQGSLTTLEGTVDTLEDTVSEHGVAINGAQDDITTLENNYAQKVAPIVDDPDYEVVLFLKE